MHQTKQTFFSVIFILFLTFGIGAQSIAEDSTQNKNFSSCMEKQGLNDCIDDAVNEVMAPITSLVAGTVFYTFTFGDTGDNAKCELNESCFGIRWIVVWLAIGALFFTFYLGFINIRGFKHSIDLVRGKYSDPSNPGEVSHFQALTTALSGTVGLGNIAGVAVAISVGGPGATFWMILAGLFGMSSKFAECTLGVKYRDEYEDGRVAGGPMFYLSKGLAEKGMGGLGKVLAIFFSICCIGGAIGGGNMFQANQSYAMLVKATGGESSFFVQMPWLYGLVLAILVGIVIIGGIRSIAKVTSKLVPLMAIIYVTAALIIIFSHISEVPAAFSAIINGAFSPEGVVGGAIGALIQGLQRAAFSNEAGIGSASIAHAAVKTKEPVTEGFVALLEPFIDTVVICTMTALVIIITGAHGANPELSGVELTSAAFSSVIPWFDYILALSVILFAYSTMLSWSYYGTRAWAYLFGHTKIAELTFKLIFCFFVIVGSMMGISNVIDFSDSMIFSMSLANILGLYILAPVIKEELNNYWEKLKSGKIKAYK
jgi:alanine or glycine:cation symporter, AGCS family